MAKVISSSDRIVQTETHCRDKLILKFLFLLKMFTDINIKERVLTWTDSADTPSPPLEEKATWIPIILLTKIEIEQQLCILRQALAKNSWWGGHS